MSSGLFKMLASNYSYTNNIYIIYVYKQDLTLNNLQGLICHKTQLTITKFFLNLLLLSGTASCKMK